MIRSRQERQALLDGVVLQQGGLGVQQIPYGRHGGEEIRHVGHRRRTGSRGHVDGVVVVAPREEVLGVFVWGYEVGLVGVIELVDSAVVGSVVLVVARGFGWIWPGRGICSGCIGHEKDLLSLDGGGCFESFGHARASG